MHDFLPFLILGLATGSIYAIAAMGLVLTYKTSGVFNFAHGAQAALGAYLMYEFRVKDSWPWPLAALAALVLAGVVAGVLLERLAYRLAAESTAARVVATVGLLVGVQGALVIRYGSASIPVTQFLPHRIHHIAGVNIRDDQFIVTALAIVAAAGLYAFFRRTRLGIGMQAVVDDPALLGLLGTSPVAVRRQAWIIGSCFAAVSGILLAPTTLGYLDATLLTLLVVQAFGAAAVGAFSSLPLTYVGGLGVGVAVELSKRYLATRPALAGLPTTLPFIILFVALLVIPAKRMVERGARAVRRHSPPAPLPPAIGAVGAAAGAAFLLVLPHVAATRVPTFLTALSFVMLFASLSLLVRLSGQVSLCQVAFAAVGASTMAHALHAGFPWAFAVLIGGAVAIPLGAIVAIPAIRLSGVYLAIATFGFGLLVQDIFFTNGVMFGHTQQLHAPRPHISGLMSDLGYYHLMLAVTGAVCLVVVVVQTSRLGRLLRGLADSPTALEAHGTNTNVTKIFVFCISAFLAGIAGAVTGPITETATGPTFGFQVSLLLLAVLAIAGRRTIVSAFVAATLYIVVPSFVTNAKVNQYFPVVFGAAAIVAAINPARGAVRRVLASARAAEREQRSPIRDRHANEELVTGYAMARQGA